ncbi:helix-turn-helix domain-containing protein [Desulfosporosinus hippei]|uniref:Transcriptional regulator, contains XRE-family HTH domain n=1 Tax=Desulfosporosinus hippei DSM 8344 TaxID=1121419 RepID=A0A1G8CAE4_9FIRM|nr:helix-turn-helix transcriptional regulator [Desulfosporosinus hippei]SDH42289.1 Transcriptional regulator, contains XRE-family HTH domain [Desulfosporosinus hippei DSM 8344]
MSKDKEERAVDPKFSLCIKHRRQEKGYSLNELAIMTAVSGSYINRLEKGERRAPSLPVMQAIAKALDFDVAELLNLATPSELEEDVCEIRNMLVKNDFRVNDTFATTHIKELVVKIFDKIISAEWKGNRFIEGGEILQTIDELEGLLKA